METSEEVEHNVLRQILDQQELAAVPPEILTKLAHHFHSKFDEFITARAILETGKQNYEKKFEDIHQELSLKNDNLSETQNKLELAEKYIQELDSHYAEAKSSILKLQENVKRLEKENLEFRTQRNVAVDERDALQSQVERRNAEVEKLRTECTSVNVQLQAAIATKFQALNDLGNIESREMTVEYKEKRLEQERKLISQQMMGLEEELTKRTSELQQAHAESSSRYLIITQQLTRCQEDLRVANESIESYRQHNSVLKQRNEELNQKIEDLRNHEAVMNQTYQEEIAAAKRLADLFNEKASNAEAKSQEFSDGIMELQELLKQASNDYEVLETKHHQFQMQYEQDMKEKQDTIDEMTKELQSANEILQSIRQEKMDDFVEKLAPTAAATSKILKEGMTLTQIYTQYNKVCKELDEKRRENEALETQMTRILEEMQEKAPMIQQNREDYERAMENNSVLAAQIDQLMVDNSSLLEKVSSVERLAKHHEREAQRLKSEHTDLGRQVCYLLNEIQESRRGSSVNRSFNDSNADLDNLTGQEIIRKKLVTFKDIEELQENNHKLLALVKDLTKRQEEMERAAGEMNFAEMKDRVEEYSKQIEELQMAQENNGKMLDLVVKQRDMYKSMAERSNAGRIDDADEVMEEDAESLRGSRKSLNESRNNEDKETIVKLQKQLDEMRSELKLEKDLFENYKKDKSNMEKWLNDEIDKVRKDSEANTQRACKLRSQLESANERLQTLQSNINIYKSQIKTLESKCTNNDVTMGKYEQTIAMLQNETMSAQKKLSSAEIEVENLKREKRHLESIESRLINDKEALQRELKTQSSLAATVELLKASFERAQVENNVRSESRLDDAMRECAALRRRLQEEQDRFREIVDSANKKVSLAEERLKEERELAQKVRAELEESRAAEAASVARIEELTNKLREAGSMTKVISGDSKVMERVKELEKLVASREEDVNYLRDQLKKTQDQNQQFAGIAHSSEARLSEMNEQHVNDKRELEKALKEAQNQIIQLQHKLKNTEEELANLSSGRQVTDAELREKLCRAECELEELRELRSELQATKSELQETSKRQTETEEKYLRELGLHAADAQNLSKLKEEIKNVDDKIRLLEFERDTAKEELSAARQTWQEAENKLLQEIKDLQDRFANVNEQNTNLHNLMEDVTAKAAMREVSQTSFNEMDESMNDSHNRSALDESAAPSEQLLKIVTSIRHEKDLVYAKFDVTRMENQRIKSQLEVMEKRMKELEAELQNERKKTGVDGEIAVKHSELLRKVENLNALSDSNRSLRQERDSLKTKVTETETRMKSLMDEVIPLREKVQELTDKVDTLTQENSSLRNDATRWRLRVNTLIEKTSRATPEDLKKAQAERDNFSKLLTAEKEASSKRFEEWKAEKSKLEEQIMGMQKQLRGQSEQIARLSEETKRIGQELNESVAASSSKSTALASLQKDLSEKEAALNDVRNKEIQIRKIAKKYKTQYEELTKIVEDEKAKSEELRSSGSNEEAATVSQEKEEQLREEGRRELRQENEEITAKIQAMTSQVTQLQTECENLKKTMLEKDERAKVVLKGARAKITQLNDAKKNQDKEVADLKAEASAKTSLENRVLRLEHENAEVMAEKEALLQRVNQLQRQLSAGGSGVSATTESSTPPTANIKPMSARSETPLASIRPMSVVVQSRTAAVLPTTASPPVLVAPQQQQQQPQSQQQAVHTTETNSPTSSHTDYQPASTSSSSSQTSSNLRQLVVQPQPNESAESTQREDMEVGDNVQQQQCMQQQQQQQQQEVMQVHQQQQQAVALVSPRVEQQQQQQSQQQQSQQQQSTVTSEQQTVPSSSTQSVSTSQASSGLKRPRSLDSTASGSNVIEVPDHSRQEQMPSPKSKRSRQEMQSSTVSAVASVSDIEYQVPTSSQRDQDEEVEESCVEVVDCDEGEDGGNHRAEEEEFEQYEEMEEEEESYVGEVEGDNNEVEIIMEEDSRSVEVPRQAQAVIPANQQQQSEAISSAGPTGEPPMSFAPRRSTGGIPPMPRQQQQQHLMLPQQGYEDAGDDCIVPSTPTLFVPRRDGFGEAVSSPQVPQGRFTFGDPTASTSASSTPQLVTPTGTTTRTIFGSSGPGVAQVAQEGMDDTRMDLTQLEDNGTGRSVPTTPLQVSPAADLPPSTSGPAEEEEPMAIPSTQDPSMPSMSDEQDLHRAETISESNSSVAPTEGIASEGEKRSDEADASGSASTDDDPSMVEMGEDGSGDMPEEDVDEENREAEASPSSNTRGQRGVTQMATAARGVTTRRSPRGTYPITRSARTPIVWGDQSMQQQQQQQQPPPQPLMRGGAVGRGLVQGTGAVPRVRGARGRPRGSRGGAKYPYTNRFNG